MNAFTRVRTLSTHRRLAVAAAVATGSLLLAACGGTDDDMAGMDHGSSSAAPSQESSDAPAPGAFNEADVTFAQSMIPHHQQAVEMSQLADGRASDPEIKSLSSRIEKAQDPEIETMRSWLKSWGKPESGSAHGMDHGSGDMEGMDHSGTAGMMSKRDMADLEDAEGTDFDKRFARMMIAHHEGAITMAEDEQSKGRNATAKKLAGLIVKAQTAEIKQMKALLERL